MQEGPHRGPSWRERRGTCGLCAAGAAASAAATEEHATAAVVRPGDRLRGVAALASGGLAAGAIPAVGGDVLRGVTPLAAGGLAAGAVAAPGGDIVAGAVAVAKIVVLDDHVGVRLTVVAGPGLEVVGRKLDERAGLGVAAVVEDRRGRANADRRGQSHDRKSSAVHRSLLPRRFFIHRGFHR